MTLSSEVLNLCEGRGVVNEVNGDSMNIIPSINHLNEYSQLILELNVPKT